MVKVTYLCIDNLKQSFYLIDNSRINPKTKEVICEVTFFIPSCNRSAALFRKI